MFASSLIKLLPRSDCLFLSRDRSVLISGRDGFIRPSSEQGLFVEETRLLSEYRYLIDQEPLKAVALSNVEQHRWLGYYIQAPPEMKKEQGGPPDAAQHTLELMVHRSIGRVLHEDLQLTNFNLKASSFCLMLKLDADFADQKEVSEGRKQHGELTRSWRKEGDEWRLRFDYHARHHYDHQGEAGLAELRRGVVIVFSHCGTEPHMDGSAVSFDVELKPGGSWRACLDFIPIVEGELVQADDACIFTRGESGLDKEEASFKSRAATVDAGRGDSLDAVVRAAAERACYDLVALRRYGREDEQADWLVSAGVPVYFALFGRDTLISGWQALMLSPEILRGALRELGKWQADARNDWRDATPNAMLHQARKGPLSVLNYNPLGRYYGTITSPPWYPLGIAEYWRWTGDIAFANAMLETALRSIKWMEETARSAQHGFFQYQTRSEQGVKNQGWKDSSDAIVYADGSQVEDPIATCEVQGYYYAAKEQLSQVLWALGRQEEAVQFRAAADEFRKRFNDAYWMEGENLYALGLDGRGRQIKSAASNAAHCLGAGIVDHERAVKISDRVMRDDMFSGWGMRTLSAQHPAYDPYSYHRGSVWPVEQGALAIGLGRYKRIDQLWRVSRAQFELAGLFEYCRLPEVLSGHQRDELHPFPALYPKANSPQAWSASAVFAILSSIMGLFPWAPFGVLMIDPQLPPWLSELRVRNLKIGNAVIAMRFFRDANGKSSHEVLELEGKLKIISHPDAWSLLREPGAKLKELLSN